MPDAEVVRSRDDSLLEKTATAIAVILPFVGLIVAIWGLWGWGFTWVELILMFVMYIATGFGITIGYHRLFTHRSFETFGVIKFALAVLGSMSVQGPVLRWVANHRCHHQYSDQENDPHSPHRYGGGFFGVMAGWWHSHIGWMFEPGPVDLQKYVGDFSDDKLVQCVNRWFPLWVFLGLLLPTVAGGLLTGTWFGVFLGFLWGGLVRVFLVHHLTWSINSICHLWGRRPFNCNDESRNNLLCGLFSLGEGWHNNHHAFPISARHGLKWWEFDASFLVISIMKRLRLVWRVQVPSADAIVHRLRSKPAMV
jgi:stearoyl-CoA desaturase (delta-9 desaturase)